MLGPYSYRPLKEGDEAAEAAARAFVRASLYERVWLHAALELPILRARAEPLVAFHGERVVGLAAALEGLFPFRMVALDGALPGVAAALFGRLEPPFVCRVPARLTRELARAGARRTRVERQMVRLDPSHSRAPVDPPIERLNDAAELQRFCGPAVTPLSLELGQYLGVRNAFGELAAVAGAPWVTDQIALVTTLETREDFRRQGLARSLAASLASSLESFERRVVAHLDAEDRPAEHLFAELGFRGVGDFAVFAR